jgi:hypothetical protein
MTTAPGPIIVGISDMIFETLCTLKREQYCPHSDADVMDECIKACETRIKTLRRIREELENTLSGALL